MISITVAGAWYSPVAWTRFVSFFGFVVTGWLFGFYSCHVPEMYPTFPWLKFEMFYCGIWSFFYITCAINLAAWIPGYYSTVSIIFGCLFSFINTGIYGYDSYTKYKMVGLDLPCLVVQNC